MFTEFTEIPFPEHANIVYVLCFKCRVSGEVVPFYVGQSSRSVGRFGDYVSAQFSASTDVKVGKAVQLFHERGFDVVIQYKPSNERLVEEKRWKLRLEEVGYDLLYDRFGFKYENADKAEELKKVEAFVNRQVLKVLKVTSIVPFPERNGSSVETIPQRR